MAVSDRARRYASSSGTLSGAGVNGRVVLTFVELTVNLFWHRNCLCCYTRRKENLCLVACVRTAFQILGLPLVSQFSYTRAASAVTQDNLLLVAFTPWFCQCFVLTHYLSHPPCSPAESPVM